MNTLMHSGTCDSPHPLLHAPLATTPFVCDISQAGQADRQLFIIIIAIMFHIIAIRFCLIIRKRSATWSVPDQDLPYITKQAFVTLKWQSGMLDRIDQHAQEACANTARSLNFVSVRRYAITSSHKLHNASAPAAQPSRPAP